LTMPKRKVAKPKEPEVRSVKNFDLPLTKFELIHLRDLFSILLPTDATQTVSQALAVAEERDVIEKMLWDKVCKLCRVAKVPLNDEAPDFIAAIIGPAPVGIVRIADEPYQEQAAPSQESNAFGVGEEK
jgi:hypothetical protein